MRRAVILLLVSFVAFAQTKRPLTHKDYDSWKKMQSPTLSRDGRFLAYGLFPQEGDGELVLRDLKSGAEKREKAGEVPPPPEASPDSASEEPPQQPNIDIEFSHNGQFVAFSVFPSREAAAAARKAKKPAPVKGLGVLATEGTGAAWRTDRVRQFTMPERSGPAVIVYLKELAPAADEKSENRPDSRGPKPGELVAMELGTGSPKRTIAGVTEYLLARDGSSLLWAIGAGKDEKDGVYRGAPLGADAETLLAGKGHYAKLTFDSAQKQVAFLSDRDDFSAKPPKPRVYLWQGPGAAVEVVSTTTSGFPAGQAPSLRGALQFSRDGGKLFVPAAPVTAEPEKDKNGEETVSADLWHWKDPFIQPMQRVRAGRERNRTYRSVYHIREKRFVQLGGIDLAALSASDDGRYVLGADDRNYRSAIDFDRLYADVYIVETATGKRRKLLEKFDAGRGGTGVPQLVWSPDGEKAVFFKDKNWHVATVRDGLVRNLTGSLDTKFFDEEEDTPSEPDSYGQSGWMADSGAVLLYDRYDVWLVPTDGQAPRNLTAGLGRKDNLQFRAVRLEKEKEDEPRGWKNSEPLLLRAENQLTRESGFWSAGLKNSDPPKKLLMGAKNYRTVAKADDANVVLFTGSRYDEFPDLMTTDLSFANMKRVTDANPQKAQLLWGTGELMAFTNTDGKPLQAALYKPENFDPKKKYPLMVYIYERLSQGVHTFSDPRPNTSIVSSYYVSNGYLVLMPDIVYSEGWPGPSAMKCVLPAVQALVDKGFVDEKAIGIQGHSWGGYQIAYMLTKTNRFRAAEAGAPVGNMTSAYNGIRWGTGLPRQFQYERTQSRIGGSLWESPMKFIENSPVFHVQDIQTPLLLIANDADDAVPWYQGIEMYLSMRRNNKEAYLFNYNGEKHGLRRRINQKDWTVRMQQFFDHYLKGAPEPEWMEKGIPFLDRETEKQKIRSILSDEAAEFPH